MLVSHLDAWHKAAQMNQSVRLPEFQPSSVHQGHAGEDLLVVASDTDG